MIFIDTNIFMYAVGRDHPLRGEAREWLTRMRRQGRLLVTSAEVGQELMHAYLRPRRLRELDDSLALWEAVDRMWPVDAEDVLEARTLAKTHTALSARDLLHLACCVRRKATELKTFDRDLAAAFQERIGP